MTAAAALARAQAAGVRLAALMRPSAWPDTPPPPKGAVVET
jgi:hypothetical protein